MSPAWNLSIIPSFLATTDGKAGYHIRLCPYVVWLRTLCTVRVSTWTSDSAGGYYKTETEHQQKSRRCLINHNDEMLCGIIGGISRYPFGSCRETSAKNYLRK